MISTATIILVKYYPLESYGQNISLCTIHSVRQSGIAPVFATCIILGLHFKVSIKERIRLTWSTNSTSQFKQIVW